MGPQQEEVSISADTVLGCRSSTCHYPNEWMSLYQMNGFCFQQKMWCLLII